MRRGLAVLALLVFVWLPAGRSQAAGAPTPATAASDAAAREATATDSAARIGEYYVQPAIDLLRRFNVVTGDPSGNMRLNDTITRAELAKVVVAAMGQEDAAVRAAANPPAFADIAGSWARGYIAVAKGLNIISGYSDGTFRPGAVVTNAEALTMLLRATGLRPAGPWPDVYFRAAQDARVLTASLLPALPPGAKATRGAVFLLAERAFTLIQNANGSSLIQRSFPAVPATITVSTPGVSGSTSAESVLVVGIASATVVLVQVNGQPAWLKNGQFAVQVPLQVGQNDIAVRAVDDLGGIVQQHLSVERR